MNAKLRALLAKRQDEVKKARAISDEAHKANRDLTDDERSRSDAHLAAIGRINEDIAREEALAAAEGNISDKDIRDIEGTAVSSPTMGFKSFGDFATAVKRHGVRGTIDERLQFEAAAPTTYGNESSGADGGFLVPPEYASEIYQIMLDEGSILQYTDQVPINGNGMVFPKDETTPWGSDGVRAYWQNEASAATQTKPKLSTSVMRLHKLFSLVPVTDELLNDAQALDAYIKGLMARSINWKANDSLVNGTGAGQPLGVLVADNKALVTVNKTSGQAANTISTQNTADMLARVPASMSRSLRWLIGNDSMPQVYTLTLGNYPVFIPPQAGVKDAPAGYLWGLPIDKSQHANTLSSQGDINLIDWNSYRTITKRGSQIETAMSMHLYFDADATAYRSIFRLDGQPKLQAAITPNKGSNKLSPYVNLQAR